MNNRNILDNLPSSCLITGGAGFIGYNLISQLMNYDIDIISVDNLNDYYDRNLKLARLKSLNDKSKSQPGGSYKFIEVDLIDEEKVSNVIKKFKPLSICHLAAQAGVRYSLENPQTYINNNILGTVNLLEAAKENAVHEFVFASTSSVYGLNEDMPFCESTSIDSTISVYSASKRSCELICHSYADNYDINFRILRFFTVYGPWGRPDMALFMFTKAILENENINVFNNGDMFRDFTFVSDIVQGFVLALSSNFKYEVFNLGYGKPVRLLDFISALEKQLGKKAIMNMQPMQSGDVRGTWADISKAKKQLGFQPLVNYEEGIGHFVKWYREYFNI